MTQWGLDTLFNPAKRHMDEEKRRLQATREQIGDASGGKRIDLESGKVKIRRTASKADGTGRGGRGRSGRRGRVETSLSRASLRRTRAIRSSPLRIGLRIGLTIRLMIRVRPPTPRRDEAPGGRGFHRGLRTWSD